MGLLITSSADMIFTNYTGRVVCSGIVILRLAIVTYVYRRLSSYSPFRSYSTISKRNFRNFDRGKFRRDISPSLRTWSCNNSGDQISGVNWKTILLSIVNNHAPLSLNKTCQLRSIHKKGKRCRCRQKESSKTARLGQKLTKYN